MMRQKVNLRNNVLPRSVVELITEAGRDAYIHKQAPKFLIDNEEHALKLMGGQYAPRFISRPNSENIVMEYIKPQRVTSPGLFWSDFELVLAHLKKNKIRHGDLSVYSVIIHGNRPFIIDFAESRCWDDPRPDKRPEGDRFWLLKTFEDLTTSGKIYHG